MMARVLFPKKGMRGKQRMLLPKPYLEYFAGDGLKEGSLKMDPGWFMLWPPAEVEQLNREYEVAQYVSDLLAFGSNGGGELLAFDSRGRVVMVPMVGMAPDVVEIVAESWADFISAIETSDDGS